MWPKATLKCEGVVPAYMHHTHSISPNNINSIAKFVININYAKMLQKYTYSPWLGKG